MNDLLAHTLFPAVQGREATSHWMVFLHGILGSRANWRGFAQRLIASRPGWGAVLLDLRLHGDSRDLALPGPPTMAAAVQDVVRTLDGLNLSASGVLGHSFGGKVGLLTVAFLTDKGANVEECWVIDSPPGARPSGTGSESTLEILRHLQRAPQHFAVRGDFVRYMMQQGIEREVAQWLAMNLRPAAGGYVLALDLPGITALLQDFFRVDAWPYFSQPHQAKRNVLVIGGNSPVFGHDARLKAQALQAEGKLEMAVVANAGHWVQVDQPDALLALMVAGSEGRGDATSP